MEIQHRLYNHLTLRLGHVSWPICAFEHHDLKGAGAMTQHACMYGTCNYAHLLCNCFLHECDHIGGEGAMTMVFFIGPCRLGSGQTLTIR
jgi:hypothetical protein